MFMDPKTNARLPSADDIYVDYLHVSIASKGHKTKTYEHPSWCRISHLAQNVGESVTNQSHGIGVGWNILFWINTQNWGKK